MSDNPAPPPTSPQITLDTARWGRFRSHAATHIGTVRKLNEDNFVNRPDLGLWAVADGAGGHQSGEVASATVAETLGGIAAGLSASEILVAVRTGLEGAHARLRAEADQRGQGATLATTVVVLLARGDHFACLWAGDSRAYLLRGAELTEITHDHSLVQELVDSGTITEAEAAVHPHANIITRAVGAGQNGLDLDKRTGRLHAGDRILLCSDGLSKTLAREQLGSILAGTAATPAEQLIQAALDAQVRDNVTALIVECRAADESDEPATNPVAIPRPESAPEPDATIVSGREPSDPA